MYFKNFIFIILWALFEWFYLRKPFDYLVRRSEVILFRQSAQLAVPVPANCEAKHWGGNKQENIVSRWELDWPVPVPGCHRVCSVQASPRNSPTFSHIATSTRDTSTQMTRHRWMEINISASKSYIRRFVITEKAPARAFSYLKAATTAFTFKTLLRHYAKRALTPQ